MLKFDNFHDCTVVITGAASGIGKALALKFLHVGANVVGADLLTQQSAFTQPEFTKYENKFLPVVCDVSSIDDLQAMCEKTLEMYGEVNILINNAGVMTRSELAKSTISDWEWIFAVNLFGVVRGIEVFLPHLRSATRAHIVNTGSMAGLAPRLAGGQAIYSASKASVVSFSETLRAELAPQSIGVSVLCPHSINTEIWRSEKHRPDSYGESHEFEIPERASQGMEPEQVANLVLAGIQDDREYIFTDAHGITTDRIPTRIARMDEDLNWLRSKVLDEGEIK